jgi:DNA-nicking Smr family endonuclease
MTSKQWIRGLLMAALVAGIAVAESGSVQAAQAAEASVVQGLGTAKEAPALHTRIQSARPDATPATAARVEVTAEHSVVALAAPKKPVPYTQPGEPPANLRRLTAAEVPVPMRAGLHVLLRKHSKAKVGALIPTTFDGKAYIARIEIHYHPEGGPVRPWGNHRGISMFVERE